jgi:hypothetical protein
MTSKDLLPVAPLLYALLPQRTIAGGLGDAARPAPVSWSYRRRACL